MGHLTATKPTHRFGCIFRLANTVLAVSLGVLLLSISVSYPFADRFSFEQQIAGHLLIIISASVLKVAYVLRCIAQHEQHKPVY